MDHKRRSPEVCHDHGAHQCRRRGWTTHSRNVSRDQRCMSRVMTGQDSALQRAQRCAATHVPNCAFPARAGRGKCIGGGAV